MADKPKETVSSAAFPCVEQGKAVQKKAPTLYAIITFKLVKGFLFLSMAVVAYCLSNNDLPREYQNLLHLLRLHPDARFCTMLAGKIAGLTESKMLWAAAGIFTYSLFALVEGFGMLMRVSWAGWMAIGESAFFIPLEVEKLMKSFSWTIFTVLGANIVIVWYLFRNRHRLFKHHLAGR